jgi:hypothetical protein
MRGKNRRNPGRFGGDSTDDAGLRCMGMNQIRAHMAYQPACFQHCPSVFQRGDGVHQAFDDVTGHAKFPDSCREIALLANAYYRLNGVFESAQQVEDVHLCAA